VRSTAGGYLATDGPKKDEANRDRRSCRRLERKVLGPAGNTGRLALTSQLLHADAEVVRRAVALLEAHGLGQAGGAQGRAAAETLAGIAPDPEALAAALLLPALEDGCLDLGTIDKRVETETARLVASAARIAVLKDYRPLGHERGEARRLRDMLLAIVEDPRGLLIRLADQLVRLRTDSTLDTATRRRLGEDTLALFAPLAGRLGVWQLKWQLEDASLRYVEPAGFDRYYLAPF
jgi:(p)ppGpp synthase/HD superfamily hydrolase